MLLELTSGVLFLIGSIYSGPAAAARATPVQIVPVADQPITLETYVRESFADTPVLAEIAKCESRFTHLGKNGKVIRGELTTEDVGVMQINEFYHDDRAEKLGFNLHTLDGNLAYAKWLYAKEGTAPWASSAKCWKKSDHLANASMPIKKNAN